MDTYQMLKFCNPVLYQETINRAHAAALSSQMTMEQAVAAEHQLVEAALASLMSEKGGYKVTRRSPFSGKFNTLEVRASPEQIKAWAVEGKLIQNAMPDVSADEREFLMTGITPTEWEETFKNTEG